MATSDDDNPYRHQRDDRDTLSFLTGKCNHVTDDNQCPGCAFEAGRAYERELSANRDAEQAAEDAYFNKLKEG